MPIPLTSELVSSGTSTPIAHHSHMLQAKEYPEDHSNSSTSPSHGQEAHDDLGIVENCHRQSIKYWRNLSQAIIQNRIQESESWLHSDVTMTTTPFSFYATNQESRRMPYSTITQNV